MRVLFQTILAVGLLVFTLPAISKTQWKKDITFELTANGEVIQSQVIEIMFVEVQAGYHFADCMDDCEDSFYWYETKSYKKLSGLEEQGYRIFEHSVDLDSAELSYKDEKLIPVVVALVKGSYGTTEALFIQKTIREQFNSLN